MGMLEAKDEVSEVSLIIREKNSPLFVGMRKDFRIRDAGCITLQRHFNVMTEFAL